MSKCMDEKNTPRTKILNKFKIIHKEEENLKPIIKNYINFNENSLKILNINTKKKPSVKKFNINVPEPSNNSKNENYLKAMYSKHVKRGQNSEGSKASKTTSVSSTAKENPVKSKKPESPEKENSQDISISHIQFFSITPILSKQEKQSPKKIARPPSLKSKQTLQKEKFITFSQSLHNSQENKSANTSLYRQATNQSGDKIDISFSDLSDISLNSIHTDSILGSDESF